MKNKIYKSTNAGGRVVFLRVYGCRVDEFARLESKLPMYTYGFSTIAARDDFVKTKCGQNGNVEELNVSMPTPLTGYRFASPEQDRLAEKED